MKNLLIAAAFILLSAISLGQDLHKGNIIGLHVLTVTLKPGISMDQFIDFYLNKYLPEANKDFPGVQSSLLKGIRGENENKFGIAYTFKSVEVRDKYFPQADKYSELTNAAIKKLQPMSDELDKLGTFTTVYTDWEVQ